MEQRELRLVSISNTNFLRVFPALQLVLLLYVFSTAADDSRPLLHRPKLIQRRAEHTYRPYYEFSGSGSLEFAEHTTAPMNPASERAWLFLKQKAKFSPEWSAIISGQGWYEAAYNNDAPPILHGKDSSDLRFQDTFAQYQDDRWIIRAGNQQIVWGETFGNFVADIVNPKDLRYGYPIDLSKTQLSTPMVNVKYLDGHFALQALYIPEPQFNILPLIGSDYAPINHQATTNFPNVVVNRQTSLPFGKSEFGLRATQTLGTADLSIFGLSYYDRNPYYVLSGPVALGQNVYLSEAHAHVSSAGQSLAWSIEDWGVVIREEAVYTAGREVSILDSSYQLAQLVTNEFAFAAAVEAPPWHRLNVALQWSSSYLFDWGNYIARNTQAVYDLSERTSLRMFTSSTLESILTVSIVDAGVRWQVEFTTPLSSRFELHFGSELYGGDGSSDFGLIQRASRVYINLKGFFHG